VYPSLAEAVSGTDLVIGTTARHRSFPRPCVEARGLRGFLAQKGDPDIYAALVFGSEQNGLTNDELALCQVVSAVPLAQPYPSLNLAQAVMVYASELADGCTGGRVDRPYTPPASERVPAATHAAFMEEARAVLALANITPDEVVYRRLLEDMAYFDAHTIGAFYTLFKRLTRKATALFFDAEPTAAKKVRHRTP
jgi:tRNA/rRNA methyltransferase